MGFGGFDLFGGGGGLPGMSGGSSSGGFGLPGMGGGSSGGFGLPGMSGSSSGSGDMFGGMLGGIGNLGAAYGIGGDPSKIYGTKPLVPDLSAEQQKAIAANQAALPGAKALASSINQFTQQQKNQMLSFVTPNWQANLGLAGEQINKMMEGELPTSDVAMSQLSSVSTALGGGFGGSPAMGNLVARDLGLRQQQVIESGLAANERWLRTAESLTAPQYDLTKMFVSPEQQYQRDWEQSLITAAPDPVARGESDAWNQIIGEVLSIYGGGAGYQGTYKPNYGGGGGASSAGADTGGGSNYFGGPVSSGSEFNIYGGSGSYTDIPATPG